jgi:HSP20 family molecular chaperone IbpA
MSNLIRAANHLDWTSGVRCFRRTFTLPDGTEPERCQAELRDGVLRISVGK